MKLDPYYADQLEDYDSMEYLCNPLGLNHGDILVEKQLGEEEEEKGSEPVGETGLQAIDIMELFNIDFDGCEFQCEAKLHGLKTGHVF